MKSSDVRDIYDSAYFMGVVDGHSEFRDFDGSLQALFPRYRRNIALMELRPEHALLEVGCGRGEVCIHHALNGGLATGLDYSEDAIAIARGKAVELGAPAVFRVSSYDHMGDQGEYFDRILASEFIEHVSRDEGVEFLRMARHRLKPGGKLLVFTMPNTLQRRFGYPVQRLWSLAKGDKLPRLQEDMMSDHYRLYHLNEQSAFSLDRAAREAGFTRFKVFYDHGTTRSRSVALRIGQEIINSTPVRHLFCNNLVLLAEP